MLRGVNVDPLNQPPTPDALPAHHFNAVRLVMRPDGNTCEDYGAECLKLGLFVLGAETNASGGYMMNSVSAYQVGNEPDGHGPSSDVQTPDEFVARFNLFTDTYHASTGKPFVAGGLCAGDYSATFWSNVAPRLRNCAGLALHPYGKTLAAVKTLVDVTEAVTPGMPVWLTEWNRPLAEIAGFDWWARKNLAGAFWFCWGDWMVKPFGLFDVNGAAKPQLGQFRYFDPESPNVQFPAPPVVVKTVPAAPDVVQKILPGPGSGVTPSWGYGRTDRDGHEIRFVVNHVAVGNGSLYNWFKGQELSTHYWVSKTGVIEQYVPDTGAAYGQGITTAGSDFPPEYPGNGESYNQMALSIEREGFPTEEATPAQWESIVALNAHLAAVHRIPVDGDHIVGHYRTDHSSRARCPSTPSLDASAYMAKLVAAVKARS